MNPTAALPPGIEFTSQTTDVSFVPLTCRGELKVLPRSDRSGGRKNLDANPGINRDRKGGERIRLGCS